MRRVVPATANPQPHVEKPTVWEKPDPHVGPCYGRHAFDGVPGAWRIVKCRHCGYAKERRGCEY